METYFDPTYLFHKLYVAHALLNWYGDIRCKSRIKTENQELNILSASHRSQSNSLENILDNRRQIKTDSEGMKYENQITNKNQCGSVGK